jgi:hypothetical protein
MVDVIDSSGIKISISNELHVRDMLAAKGASDNASDYAR